MTISVYFLSLGTFTMMNLELPSENPSVFLPETPGKEPEGVHRRAINPAFQNLSEPSKHPCKGQTCKGSHF